MSKALEEYDLPAQLQKAESKVSTAAMVRRADQRYLEFQKKMWNEAGKLNELNQKEPGAAEDDLEEISVTLVTKCPITQKEFVKPVQNTKCKHSYEESVFIFYFVCLLFRSQLSNSFAHSSQLWRKRNVHVQFQVVMLF